MKIIFITVLTALMVPAPAQAYVFWEPDQLETSFFPPPTVVDTEPFTPSAAQRTALRDALGYPLPHETYPLRIGRRDGDVVGFAIFDQQLGQHEPIDFGVLLDSDGKVLRVEILVYREAYGDGVRSEAFRHQFTGLGPAAPMRPGRDIRIVSGATVSTRSISVGVRRACLLVASWLGRPLS